MIHCRRPIKYGGIFTAALLPLFVCIPGERGIPQKIAILPDVTNKAAALMQKHCLGCHGVGATLSGFDMRSRASLLKGGLRGPAVQPGAPEKSLLYKLVTDERTPKMPPSATDKLTTAELTTIREWIALGAPYPGAAVMATAAKQTWWSFKPPVLPPVPTINVAALHPVKASSHVGKEKSTVARPGNLESWLHNPVDSFVLDRLLRSGMRPSPQAARRVLMRRAVFDLTGLPPTPEEMAAFLADKSPTAYANLVDRLLASPRYGERWGRHWLDLVRYADSGGFEGDKDRPLAWKYRDFVIRSFNSDMPYNRFVTMQVAGDELAAPSPDSIVATGYLACGPVDIVMINEQNRANELDDIVSTTGSAFLGLTVGCARCHDHKYDPITQADYYRLSAIFAPSERREIEIPTDAERKTVEAESRLVDSKIAPLKPRLDALTAVGTAAAKAKGQPMPTVEQISAALNESDRKAYTEINSQIAAIEATRPGLPKAMAVTDKARVFPASHLLIRGDPYHPGAEVKPGFICSLPGGAEDVGPEQAMPQTTGRRTALASWLVKGNPLLSRVWVNRVWRQHFGHGIVDTPSNFGVSGQLPSHPELLDWLAIQFERSGWSTKALHRMIMLSATYQQSSAIRPDLMQKDPLNRMLWRMPVRRVEAEVVRDSILATAGTLNLQMGGPPVYPPVDPTLRADTFQGPNWQDGEDGPSTWRRSVYVKVKRSLLLPELEVFDCPEITNSVAARNVTTTPTQALTLLNGPFVQHQAALFAARVLRETADKTQSGQITKAYQLAFARSPSAEEARACQLYLTRHTALGVNVDTGLVDLCHALLNFNEFVYVE